MRKEYGEVKQDNMTTLISVSLSFLKTHLSNIEFFGVPGASTSLVQKLALANQLMMLIEFSKAG